MIYAIYKYGLRMEAIGFLDMYMFWHLQFSVTKMDKKESSKKPLSPDLQFSVTRFAIFSDSLYFSPKLGRSHTHSKPLSPDLQFSLTLYN